MSRSVGRGCGGSGFPPHSASGSGFLFVLSASASRKTGCRFLGISSNSLLPLCPFPYPFCLQSGHTMQQSRLWQAWKAATVGSVINIRILIPKFPDVLPVSSKNPLCSGRHSCTVQSETVNFLLFSVRQKRRSDSSERITSSYRTGTHPHRQRRFFPEPDRRRPHPAYRCR